MKVLGIGVVLAVVVGIVYGLFSGNVPRGLGQAAVVLFLSAIVGVGMIYRAEARRKQARR